MLALEKFKRPAAITSIKNGFVCVYGNLHKKILFFYKANDYSLIDISSLGLSSVQSLVSTLSGNLIIFDSFKRSINLIDQKQQLINKFHPECLVTSPIKLSINGKNIIFTNELNQIILMPIDFDKSKLRTIDFSNLLTTKQGYIICEIAEFKFLLIDKSNSQGYLLKVIDKELILEKTFLCFGREGRGKLRNPTDINFYNGLVFINDADNYLIQVFNQALEFLFQIGGKGDRQGSFDMAMQSSPSKEHLWISDYNNDRVQKFVIAEKKFSIQVSNKAILGEITRPSGICTDGNDLYVVDRSNGFINKFSKDLKFLQRLKFSRDLHRPSSLTILSDGPFKHLVICERRDGNNSMISYATLFKNATLDLVDISLNGNYFLNDPQDITSDLYGNIFIMNTMNREILKINLKGDVLQRLDLKSYTRNPKILSKCINICSISGDLLVADFESRIILHFNNKFELIRNCNLQAIRGIEVIREVFHYQNSYLICGRGKNYVYLVNYEGDDIQSIDITKSSNSNWKNPTKICRIDNLLYIADKENDRIVCLNDSLNYINSTH